MRLAVFIGSAAILLLLGGLWYGTRERRWAGEIAIGPRVLGVTSHRGAVKLVLFSREPEDESYHTCRIPFALLAAVASVPVGFGIMNYRRHRRNQRARGFPVQIHVSAKGSPFKN